MGNYTLPINSSFTESGDDVYGKPLDSDFSGVNWVNESVGADELADTNVYEIVLNDTKGYVFYLNGHSQAFTADATTDVITAVAHGLMNGDTLRFKGTDLPAGLAQSTLYYVRDKTDDTFKVEASPSTTAVNITDAGSGAMTFTAPSLRSKADDTKIGTVPAVNSVPLTGEAEASLTLIQSLLEADQVVEELNGVQVLRTYQRGTDTELIPAKLAKQPGGSALTNPVTQQLAGYREE